jgi:hypothetical protein
VIEDDGNLAWEDIEYESDCEFEYEMRWKADEKENGEKSIEARDPKELKSSGYNRQRQSFEVSQPRLVQGLV